MEWMEIVKAITELGIMAVICGIFLWQNNKDRKNHSSESSKLFETLLQQYEQTFNKMLNSFNPDGHVLTEEEDRKALEIDRAIDDYLKQMIINTKATRSFVVRYHNGGKDMAAIPFLKCSITNEMTNAGVKPIMGEFQNQFRSIMAGVCEEIDRKGYSYITPDKKSELIDPATVELMKDRGIKYMYCRALRNQNNYIIGLVAVTFMIDNQEKPNEEIIDLCLKDKSQKISALLCLEN